MFDLFVLQIDVPVLTNAWVSCQCYDTEIVNRTGMLIGYSAFVQPITDDFTVCFQAPMESINWYQRMYWKLLKNMPRCVYDFLVYVQCVCTVCMYSMYVQYYSI